MINAENVNKKSLLVTNDDNSTSYEIVCDILTCKNRKVYNSKMSPLYMIQSFLTQLRPYDVGYVCGIKNVFNLIKKPINFVQELKTLFLNINLDFFGKFVKTKHGDGVVKSASLDINSGIVSWELEYRDIDYSDFTYVLQVDDSTEEGILNESDNLLRTE